MYMTTQSHDRCVPRVRLCLLFWNPKRFHFVHLRKWARNPKSFMDKFNLWTMCYEFGDTWQTEWHNSPLPVASNWNISEHNNFLIRLLLPILHLNHTFELRPSPLVFLVNSFFHSRGIFQLLGMTWLLPIQFQLVSKYKNYSSKRYSTSYILPLNHKNLQKCFKAAFNFSRWSANLDSKLWTGKFLILSRSTSGSLPVNLPGK